MFWVLRRSGHPQENLFWVEEEIRTSRRESVLGCEEIRTSRRESVLGLVRVGELGGYNLEICGGQWTGL